MAILSIPVTYADGDTLYKSDLDNIVESVETLINVTKLDTENFSSQGVTASTKIQSGSITSDKLAPLSISAAKIVDAAVQSGNIVDGTILTASIADSTIASSNIVDASLTTDEIYLTTTSYNSYVDHFTTSSSSYVSTGASTTFTSDGLRPTMIMLQHATDNYLVYGGGVAASTSSASCAIQYRVTLDSSTIIYQTTAGYQYYSSTSSPTATIPLSNMVYLGVLSAGSHTVVLDLLTTANSFTINMPELLAIEL